MLPAVTAKLVPSSEPSVPHVNSWRSLQEGKGRLVVLTNLKSKARIGLSQSGKEFIQRLE